MKYIETERVYNHMVQCKEGEIVRTSYDAVRAGKKYHVKATCITDVGVPGKTPRERRIPVGEKDDLTLYGYDNLRSLPAEKRHSILKKAILDISKKERISVHDSAVRVMRRLNLLFVLNKNTNVTLSQLLERDRNWVGREYLGRDYTA